MADSKNAGWYVISLRPRGEHEGVRRAAARRGAGLIALSPWRIQAHADDATREALRAALSADRVLFTSPAAVTAAARLQPLQATATQIWLAVGAGTAQALRRQGIADVRHPGRMDSEGLLALPELQQVRGCTLGFVTAPDGRNVLAPALEQRGAQVLRAEVYERAEVAVPTASLHRFRELASRACLLLSSGGALERLLAQLNDSDAALLRGCPVIAASHRLADAARAAGFTDVSTAAGPRPVQLLDAAVTRRPGAIR